MKNISSCFSESHQPIKGFVVNQHQKDASDIYVEAYDLDEKGFFINAHPLSMLETIELAESLNTSRRLRNGFLISRSILPQKVLHINPAKAGRAIWYTPTQRVHLLFKKDLTIPCGQASVPAMIWAADKDGLQVFAIKTTKKPDAKSPLYHAPFFNIYEDGTVCMGTVNIDFEDDCYLEDFIEKWETYFWKSYFSHLINDTSPVKMNIIQLWQDLVNTETPFPNDLLKRNGQTLKDLI